MMTILGDMMEMEDIKSWLSERNKDKLDQLWRQADQTRIKHIGDQVHCRGLIEISNYCWRSCHYCGLRHERESLERYRMSKKEILDCSRLAQEFGYGTVVIQSGEDKGFSKQEITDIIESIKKNSDLAITLSLGEQHEQTFRDWYQAGADRYLLRIETTDAKLLSHIHPGEPYGSRMNNLEKLKNIGYEVGSGVMVGIPGQTTSILAKDILWFKEFDLDMIGIGPFLSHPDTPLGQNAHQQITDQVESSELQTNIAVALTRLNCPTANIPATTALASINKKTGRETALAHGANIVMPNLTPSKYRMNYEIYPNKACIDETADICHNCMKSRIIKSGRSIGIGKGSRNKVKNGI